MISGRGRVVVVAAFLEDKNVNLLEVDVTRMEADRVPLRKDPVNAGIVDVVKSHL